MTELEGLPLNSFLLKKNPDIILTIKKVKWIFLVKWTFYFNYQTGDWNNE